MKSPDTSSSFHVCHCKLHGLQPHLAWYESEVGDDRVDVGVTERMLLENLELTRTGCLAVVHEVQERLGALSREAGAQRRNSIKAWQAEQLERKDIVRGRKTPSKS